MKQDMIVIRQCGLPQMNLFNVFSNAYMQFCHLFQHNQNKAL